MDVRREIVLPAGVGEVWSSLVEPEQLERWLASSVELEAVPGGRGRFVWDDGSEREAIVEDVEPEVRLALRWADPADPGSETAVTFELEEVDGGTRVTVTEASPEPSACAGEWGLALELRVLLAPAAIV